MKTTLGLKPNTLNVCKIETKCLYLIDRTLCYVSNQTLKKYFSIATLHKLT